MLRYFENLRENFSRDLALDLGSTNTLIYQKGSGIVLDEPSLIAFQRTEGGAEQVIGTGAGARELLNKRTSKVRVVRPVQHGVIADFDAAREMLRSYLDRIKPQWLPAALRVITNVPAQATTEEKRSIRKMVRSAGANEVYLMEEPRALALGAGLDIAEEKGRMVLDIGGGITEMAVILEGKVVCAESIRIGGEHLDRAIATHMRSRHNLHMEEHMAEMLKIHIGTAYPGRENQSIEVEGLDLTSGMPGHAAVNAYEICEVLSPSLRTIINTIQRFLGTLPPGLYVDVLDRGITLAGGGALLRGLDRLIEREVLMPVILAQEPLACMVRGTGDALEYMTQLRQLEGPDEQP